MWEKQIQWIPIRSYKTYLTSAEEDVIHFTPFFTRVAQSQAEKYINGFVEGQKGVKNFQ